LLCQTKVAGGFVSFTDEFKYLGALSHHSLTSDADIHSKLAKATAAFGAVRSSLFSDKNVDLK
jgi:hypothetical protein